MELSKAAIRKLVDGMKEQGNPLMVKTFKLFKLFYRGMTASKGAHLTLVSGIDQHNLLLVYKQKNKNVA